MSRPSTSACARSASGFTQEPTQMALTTAILDDTCGNLIQIAAAG